MCFTIKLSNFVFCLVYVLLNAGEATDQRDWDAEGKSGESSCREHHCRWTTATPGETVETGRVAVTGYSSYERCKVLHFSMSSSLNANLCIFFFNFL